MFPNAAGYNLRGILGSSQARGVREPICAEINGWPGRGGRQEIICLVFADVLGNLGIDKPIILDQMQFEVTGKNIWFSKI